MSLIRCNQDKRRMKAMPLYNDDFETGKVIAALRKDFVCPGDTQECYIHGVTDGIDYEKAEVIFHSGMRKSSGAGNILLIYLKRKDKYAVIDAIETLSANPYVLYAEPDYLVEEFIIPNDPLFRNLWGMKKVRAPLAWNYATGNAGVSVGVIDSGIEYNHPDIRNNMWVSPDGRFVGGWNFYRHNSDATDLTGHGTHVAGTIGAVGNNGVGITGLCWRVRVASLRFGFDIASAIAAIDFANIYSIPILNSSWGGRTYSPALKLAIDQYDGLFVTAAGNYGTNNDIIPDYPGSYDSENIITVAAANPNDALARFSNYGAKSVDIAAPGTDILSLGLRGSYSIQNGTSMAAPHVAGAAALLKAYMPGLTTAEMKNIILSSAAKRPALTGRVLTGGMLDVNAMFLSSSLFV